MSSKIVFVVLAMCIAQSLAEKCNPLCTREFKPLCGVDNTGNQKTFSNQCLLDFEDCSNRGAGWRVLADGQCPEAKTVEEESEEVQKCNGICTRIYMPVCGVDNTGNMRTFSNKCVFESEECNNRGAGWRLLAEDKCDKVDSKVSKCNQFCTFEYNPVCAMDNTGNVQTFGNKCTFESEECNNRGAGWRLVSKQACEETKIEDTQCRQFCTMEYNPVCAMDNTGNTRTFGNKCTFESEECNNRGAGWRIVSSNSCEQQAEEESIPKCRQFCTFEYSPVCAMDNTGNMRTFGNKCTFESEECNNRGAGWRVVAENACSEVQAEEFTAKQCPKMCTFEYAPLCAVDNFGNQETFSNKCSFDMAQCFNRGAGWRVVNEAECLMN